MSAAARTPTSAGQTRVQLSSCFTYGLLGAIVNDGALVILPKEITRELGTEHELHAGATELHFLDDPLLAPERFQRLLPQRVAGRRTS